MAYSVSTRFRHKTFIDHFSINASFDQSTILTLPKAYRTSLSLNQLELLEGRLVYYEHIFFVNKHICRIVVPFPFHHKMFNLTHATPVAGNMGEYKYLYRIRLRFFWPRICTDIKEWIQNFLTVHSHTTGYVVVKN